MTKTLRKNGASLRCGQIPKLLLPLDPCRNTPVSTETGGETRADSIPFTRSNFRSFSQPLIFGDVLVPNMVVMSRTNGKRRKPGKRPTILVKEDSVADRIGNPSAIAHPSGFQNHWPHFRELMLPPIQRNE